MAETAVAAVITAAATDAAAAIANTTAAAAASTTAAPAFAKQPDLRYFKPVAITFDFWNTLMFVAEPRKLYEKRMARVEKVLAAAGHHRDWETILEAGCLVWDKTMSRQYLQGLDYTPLEQIREIVQHLDLDERADYFSDVYTAYTEPFLDDPPLLMEGARETLAALAPYFRLGIICNTGATPGQVLRQLLKQFELDHFFAVKTFSNELELAKPNPKIFQQTLGRLGVAPTDAVHIGDDPRTDVAGAGAVGMRTIWFNNNSRHPLPKKLPDFTWRVSSLREVPSILLPLRAKAGSLAEASDDSRFKP